MFCTECEDTSATLLCLGCEEEYCQLCWESLHRRGVRAKHVTRPLNSTLVAGAIAGVGGAQPAPETCTNGSSSEGGNAVGSSDETVTERPRARPDDHEAPLCPSGQCFSKPLKDPSGSPVRPNGLKLASSSRVEVALLPASSDSSASERKTSPEREGKRGDDCKGGEKRSRSPNSGDEQLPKVAKRQSSSSPGEASQSVIAAETAKAAEAEGIKAVSPGPSVLEAEEGALLPASSTSSASERKTSPEREGKGADDGKGGEKRSRSSNSGDQQLAKVAKRQLSSSPGEASQSVIAAEMAKAVEAAEIKGASPGPSALEAEEDVGPARVPTEVEKAALASMSRRAITVPLRLDAREREILGVLTRALRKINYTDEVDRIMLKGTRLESVVRNLKRFFTSISGLFTASGVRATTMREAPPPHQQQPPHHGKGKGRQSGISTGLPGRDELPFGTSGSGWRFLRGSSSAGGALSGNGNRLVTARGSGARAADVAAAKGKDCGAGSYRADSFPLKKGSMGITKEWMYILMDAQHPLVKQETGFSCVRAMRTVKGLSQSCNLLGLLDDPDLILATKSILPWNEGQVLGRPAKEADQIATEAAEKAKARKRLLTRHGKGGLEGEVSLVIDSLADSIVERDMATRPIRRMVALLKTNWTPDLEDGGRSFASLAICSGEHGSRLSHDHGTQFHFVLQSLYLWQAIVDNMVDMRAYGEVDMLAYNSRYSLEDTGQGLQRVQAAPKIRTVMHRLQQQVADNTKRSWVGSPVIHLGDDCVPNAMIFLDKYCQVSPILKAIIQVIDYLDDLDEGKDSPLMEFIKTRWQNVDGAKRHILHDFFRSGFDGSGADNDNDAGNCVDGRLTSVWNWCSELETKDFYHLFKCSGFRGFDGDFSS